MQQTETIKKYDTYKDSGIEWIGEIPQAWNLEPLKMHSKIYGRIGFRGYTQEDLVDEGEGAITLSPTNIIDNTLTLEKCQYLSWNKYYESPEIMVDNGDILFVKTASVGKCAIYTSNELATINPQFVVFKNVTCNSKYLFYMLLSEVIQTPITLSNLGSVVGTIKQSELASYKIPIPSINEQQYIADYLDKKCGEIDRVVETEKSVIEKLKEYKQSIITEAVTKGLDKSVPLKDSGIEWIGKIPQHWDLMPLKFALNQRFEKNDPVQTEERLSLSIGLGVTLYSEKTTNLDRYKDDCSQYKLAYPDDLVINSMNVIVGAVGISKYFGCVSPAYYVLYSSDENKFKTEFFDYLFKTSTIRKFLFSIGKGIMAIERGNDRVNTCRLKVSAYDLGRLNFPIPSKQEQEEICNYLDKKCSEIDKAIADKEQVIEKFTEYKKSLIYECVTGKRKVVE